MVYLRNFLSLLAMLLALGYISPVKAADDKNTRHNEEESFARSFANTVLAIIQDQKKSYADRKDILRTAFANSVDIDWIAKFVLGKTWSTASDEQKTRYMALYRKFLTETYVSNFAENPDKRIRDIKIFGVNDSDDSDTPSFTVRTEMQLADQENVKVNYLVDAAGGHYKLHDIAIENVSMIATHRAEFSAIATSKGITGIIAELEQRVNGAKSITLSMN